jgi:hypothetical protein
MSLNFFSSSRRIPDVLMEELVTVLLCAKTFEFKALFEIVHSAMKERKVSGGGEEMLRLRAYDKLQSLVREGGATKVGGRYKGVRKQLLIVAEQLKDRHLPKTHSAGVAPAHRSPSKSTAPAKHSSKEE